MADHINPFSEDFIEDFQHHDENETIESEESPTHNQTAEKQKITADSVAEYLLNKQYVLAALEFHMELMEAGKELPRLRNYFSNPGNFEQQVNTSRDTSNSLYRTGSISTFDSLDLTRYSDDGTQQQDDKVAILEFELRKAKEMINSLRMSLTGALEEDSFLKVDGHFEDFSKGTQQKNDLENSFTEKEQSDRNPLVKRALNYLVNEYLLQNDYKLTSITLADENEEQDFEDWHDVGLNMPKPPGLSKLFHEYSTHLVHQHDSCNVAVGTEDEFLENTKHLESLQTECEKLERENADLASVITQLRKESSVSLESITNSTPKHNYSDHDDRFHFEENSRTPVRSLSRKTSRDTPHSVLSKTNSVDTVNAQDDGLDDIASCHGALAIVTDRPPQGRMSEQLWQKLVTFWHDDLDVQHSDGLANEVVSISTNLDELISTLSSCLPKIVPTVLLQKRDQLMPLLLSTAALHRDIDQRMKLLHNLFNLIKKPDVDQRRMILLGCAAYAKLVGPMRTEEDLLPQFWEQIGHKYTERRHLVAEACGVTAPFLRPEMRNSLLLSILQQMEQEESVEEIRQAIVRSLAVMFALLDDNDKYTQAFRMLCAFLQDVRLPVQETARKYLLPAFACWSRHSGQFCDHLLHHMLCEIESTITDRLDNIKNAVLDESAFVRAVENLIVLIPHCYIDILRQMPTQYQTSDALLSNSEDQYSKLRNLELELLFGDEKKYRDLEAAFSTCIANADMKNWSSLTWCLFHFIPRILEITRQIDPNHLKCVEKLSAVFSVIFKVFGKEFVSCKVKDKFSQLFSIKQDDASREITCGNTSLTSAAVPVYACGILTMFKDEQSLSSFLSDMISTLASCHASLVSIETTFGQIRQKGDTFHGILLDILWNCITHPSAFVRAAAASLFAAMATDDVDTKILTTRVLPALLTLSKDNNENVRAATIPSFGALLECSHIENEIIDRVMLQFSSFLSPSRSDSAGDSSVTTHHSINVQMVRTLAQVTPKADPRFRDEFVLPHLAAIAAKNNQETNRTKRSDIALALLEAFTNISCCFIPDSLLQSAFLPGLRCLAHDIEQLHKEHLTEVNKLVINNELKLEQRTPTTPNIPEFSTAPITDKNKVQNKPKFWQIN